MLFLLAVAANDNHSITLNGLPAFAGALMSLQCGYQNVDRNRGELVIGKHVFPDPALGLAEMIRRLPAGRCRDGSELRQHCRLDVVEAVSSATMHAQTSYDDVKRKTAV